MEDIVKIDFRVHPRIVLVEAVRFIVHYSEIIDFIAFVVQTLVECATKKLDTDDAEDEPEDQDNHNDIANSRDGMSQGIHDDLLSEEIKVQTDECN